MTDDADQFLIAYLAERDVTCPACGYNLRGLLSPRCPECAKELTLNVGLREPRLAAFLTGVVALAGGAGFNAMLMIYMIIIAWVRNWSLLPWTFPFVVIVGFLIEFPLLLLWIRSRGRLAKLSPPARMALVVAAYVLTVLDVLVFSWVIK